MRAVRLANPKSITISDELQSVIVLDKTHPITAGVEDFDVHDEQHFTFIDEHRGYTPPFLSQRHFLRKHEG